MATVGTGAHTYELVEDWAQIPAGWTLGQTAIVTDARDQVYLFNRSDHPLMVFDRDGNFRTSWGEGVLSSAHGMFIDQQGNLYVTGPGGLWVLSADGKHLGTIIPPKEPHNIAWGDEDGKTLYITAGTGVYRVRSKIEGIRP